jgi:hypothetical protein
MMYVLTEPYRIILVDNLEQISVNPACFCKALQAERDELLARIEPLQRMVAQIQNTPQYHIRSRLVAIERDRNDYRRARDRLMVELVESRRERDSLIWERDALKFRNEGLLELDLGVRLSFCYGQPTN